MSDEGSQHQSVKPMNSRETQHRAETGRSEGGISARMRAEAESHTTVGQERQE